MGFRFRKSFKLLPGVRLNVSKSGTSFSVGQRGATVNLKDGKARGTVGVPGSGLSYSANLTEAAPSTTRAPAPAPILGSAVGILVSLVQIAFWLGLIYVGLLLAIGF